jgi:hypothetical protein
LTPVAKRPALQKGRTCGLSFIGNLEQIVYIRKCATNGKRFECRVTLAYPRARANGLVATVSRGAWSRASSRTARRKAMASPRFGNYGQPAQRSRQSSATAVSNA